MSGINLLNKTCNKSSFMYKCFDDIETGVYEVKFFEPLTTKYGKRIGASLAGGKCRSCNKSLTVFIILIIISFFQTTHRF